MRDNTGYRLESAGLPYLPRLLAEAGYATGAAVSAWSLRGRAGFADGFDFYDDRIPLPERAGLGGIQRPGAVTLSAALGWLRTAAAGGPFFFLLHLFEPHTPWAPPEPFASRHPSPYDGEVAAADAVVGRLLAELVELGVYDRAVIVLLSDHGEGLGDHGEQEHGILLYREALQVPLVVKLPGGARGGERVAAPVGLVDLAPTLLELAGLEAPADLDGRSLLADPAGEPRPIYAESWYPRFHFGWSELGSLIEERWHLIDGPDPELYDLVADPGETDNRIARRAALAARLRGELGARSAPPEPPVEESEEARRALAALGYLGGTARVAEGELPDPKSRLGTAERIKQGLRSYSAGDFAAAAAAYRQAVADNPGSLDAWEYLGRSLGRLGRHREAAAAYREAFELSGSTHLALAEAQSLMAAGRPEEGLARLRAQLAADPGDERLLLLEARTLAATGRLEEAFAKAEAVLAAHPDSADAVYLRGAVQIGRGRLGEAERDLRRALELAPAHTAAMSDLAMLLRHRGDLAGARALLERVLALNPDDATAARHLADLDRRAATPAPRPR